MSFLGSLSGRSHLSVRGRSARTLHAIFSSTVLIGCLASLPPVSLVAQEGPLPEAADPPHLPAQSQRSNASPAPVIRASPQPTQPLPPYDKAIFLRPWTPDQISFITSFAKAPSGDLYGDRQFRKLMKSFVPDCMFHYGRDMPLDQALDAVLSHSDDPVTVRDGRYVLLSGSRGPYLGGRGFLWLDLVDGIGLGGFYFQPINGEPTPTLAVFSRQVKEPTLEMSQLPPAFTQDLSSWASDARVPEVTTRYFLNASNKRILLEHDEDYCSPNDGTVPPSGNGCEQMNADAADLDETAAYYLEQIHYATNGTAWTIGGDQIAWVAFRDNRCGGVANPLGCRILITREHTHSIIFHRPVRINR